MKKTLIAIMVFLLSACGGSEVSQKKIESLPLQPPSMVAEWPGWFSSWWEIPQYYNGVPKYSGAFGTYTHKHVPVATWANGHLYHVRTDNGEGDGNFNVYAMKDTTESVLVHTIENWNDPHTQAAIKVLPDGHVMVHIASRGLAHKFQSGKIYKSRTPYELDFECIDGCVKDNIEAYPQLHNTARGYQVLYTEYVRLPGYSLDQRQLRSRIGSATQDLTNSAHYAISHYANGELCVARNHLINGSPEYRINLYFTCTSDGTAWESYNGDPIQTPWPNDNSNRIYLSGDDPELVFLKDIYFFGGEWHVLFTVSTSADPTKGDRYLMHWRESNGSYPVTTVGHNYSAGSFIEHNSKLYIIAGKSSVPGYLSGHLELYDAYTNVLFDTLQDGQEYSYVRRVDGANSLAVMSMGASDIEVRAEHYILKIE